MSKKSNRVRFPLNVYLFKEEVEDALNYIDLTDLPRQAEIDIGAEKKAVLRYGWVSSTPDWFRLLSGMTNEPLDDLKGASMSGILMTVIKSRALVITFGHAWQKIKNRWIEPNFGIKCVLNLAEEKALRSIRRDRIAEDFIQAIEQIPDSDDIYRFGMDLEKDLLRGVKASIDIKLNFGPSVAGGDSFKGSVDIDDESIASYLSRCIDIYQRKDYKKNFPWVDNIHPIRDDGLKAALTSELVKDVSNKRDGLTLCVPDFLSWDDYDFFSFERKKRGQSACANVLDLNWWVDFFTGSGGVIDVNSIYDQYIYAYKQGDVLVNRWQIFECIHGSIVYHGKTYLIHGGQWFELDDDFVKKVEDGIGRIEYSSISLPPTKISEKEGDYNKRVSVGSNGSILLMDRKLIHYGGGKSRFEVCDLLTENGHLICVKPWGGGSGSLSHLFLQAKNSIRLINDAPDYIDAVSVFLKKYAHQYDLTWHYICKNSDQAEVVLAVMRGCRKENLPFFAKLSLMDCVSDLQRMRFKATYYVITHV